MESGKGTYPRSQRNEKEVKERTWGICPYCKIATRVRKSITYRNMGLEKTMPEFDKYGQLVFGNTGGITSYFCMECKKGFMEDT